MTVIFPESYGGIELIDDYAEEMLENILGIFKEQTRIEAFVRAYANRVTELEGAIFQTMYLLSSLDAAADVSYGGEWLRRFGVLVGQSREGSNDATWAAFIRARIAANRSSGAGDELIDIVHLIYDTYDLNGTLVPAGVSYAESYPKSAAITLLDDTGDIDPVAVARLLQDAKPAGTRLHLIYGSGFEPLTEGFTWGYENLYPEASTTLGYGSVTNVNIGGKWLSATGG